MAEPLLDQPIPIAETPRYIVEAVGDLLFRGTRGQRVIAALTAHFLRARAWPSETDLDALVAGAAFMCPDCGAVSHNYHDAVERYCGRCRVFVDDVGFGS